MTIATPLVGVIMGSRSDWETMRHAADTLDRARRAARGARGVGPPHAAPALRVRLTARAARPGGHHRRRGRGGPPAGHDRGEDRAAGAGRAGRVGRRCTASIRCCRSCRCRAACPVGTLAIGRAGAVNAALLAAAILGAKHPEFREALRRLRATQTSAVLGDPDPRRRRHDRRRPRRRAARAHAGARRLPARPRASASSTTPPAPRPATSPSCTPATTRTSTSSERFADGLDVVTYEFENVPVASARSLAERLPVYPPPQALEAAQDRLVEKTFFHGLGIPTPRRSSPSIRTDASRAALRLIGLPAVLKTRRLGYDGKGQIVLREPQEAEYAWRALGDVPQILEGFVPFRASCRCSRCAAAAARRRSIRWSRTTTARASCGCRSPRRRASTPDLQAQAEEYAPARAGALGLRRRAGDRVLRGRRPAAGQRDGPARPQLRPLDHRGGRDEPVREPPARRPGPAARLGGGGRPRRRWST